MRFHSLLRALEAPHYRRFFTGQAISLVGNWMTTTATGWLIFELTRDPFLVGLSVFLSSIPSLFLAPFMGVVVDRIDRRRALLATNVLSLLQSLLLAVLTFGGWVNAEWILVLCLFQGLVNSLDLPLRHALTIEFVQDRTLLPNAIALNSLMFNVARIVGPALAGGLIAVAGPAVCFGIDALSYLPVLVALATMSLATPPRAGGEAHPWSALREGFAYAWREPALRQPLLLAAMVSLVGFVQGAMAPVLAREVYGGSSLEQGAILSAFGVGALGAAVYLGTRASAAGIARRISLAVALLGTAQVAIGFISWFPLALLVMVFAGAGAVLAMVGCNTLIQSVVQDEKRGRVMGLFTTAQSLFPLGSIAAGAIAAHHGAPLAVAAAGGVSLLAAAWFYRGLGGLEPQVARLQTR